VTKGKGKGSLRLDGLASSVSTGLEPLDEAMVRRGMVKMIAAYAEKHGRTSTGN
jgi:hypothetical protein